MIPKLHRYETLSSTMDEARALAVAGAPEGTMVQADAQTAGRGRFGNQWTSLDGNLYVTVVLRPRVAVRHVAQMSFATALALADAVERTDIALKWPNDVLAGGRKLAGILLEVQSGRQVSPDFLLVGVGVNVAAAPEGRACVNENGVRKSADEVRDAFFTRLAHWYDIWLREGFAPVRAAWLARAHGLNGAITARLARESLDGVFDGIDDAGNLMLRRADGQRLSIASGDVHFAPNPSAG